MMKYDALTFSHSHTHTYSPQMTEYVQPITLSLKSPWLLVFCWLAIVIYKL